MGPLAFSLPLASSAFCLSCSNAAWVFKYLRGFGQIHFVEEEVDLHEHWRLLACIRFHLHATLHLRNIHQSNAKTIIYLTCTLQPWKVNTANLAPLWNWGKSDWIGLWLGLWSLDILKKIITVTWYLLCATISVPKISAWPERSSTTTLSVFPQSTCSW